jgi:putative transcriptional regulator
MTPGNRITQNCEGVMITTQLERILEERERTLYWLAKESGVGYKTLHKLARGNANSVTFPVLSAICELLECQPGDLLHYQPEKSPKRR